MYPRFAALLGAVALLVAAAGAAFGIVGGLGAWAMHHQRGSFVIWVGAGAVALAAEGAVMGAALGAQHSRLGTVLYAEQVFNLSIGENTGRVLAGPEPGPRAATGWAIGYALDGALAGAMVGTFVGPAAVAALLKLG
jgi:hypothetical protein